MLGKLMKYDLRSGIRTFSLIWIGLAVLAAINGFTLRIAFDGDIQSELANFIITVLPMVLLVALYAAMGIFVLVFINFPEYSYVTLFVQTGKAFSATAHGITVGATVAFDYICRGARWFSRMAVLTAHYLWIALCWTFGWLVRGIIGFWHSLIDAVKSGTDVDDEE